MHQLFTKLGSLLLAPFIAIGSLLFPVNAPVAPVPSQEQAVQSQIDELQRKLYTELLKTKADLQKQINENGATPVFGAYNPTGGGTYRLQSSIGTTDTSISLSSFKEPISNLPYTMSYLNSSIEYGTLEPGNTTKKEFISFTGITQNSDGSATLTGVQRGLAFSYPFTASTTLQQTHSGQSIFILSNTPQFYGEFLTLKTNATSSAFLTFGSTTPPGYDTGMSTAASYASTSNFASVAYANSLTIAGAPVAVGGTAGTFIIGTGAQAGSTTPDGSGAGGASFALTTGISTSSPYTAGSYVVTTMPNGKIKQNFLDLTEPFTFTGSTTISATTTLAATTTINNIPYIWPKTHASTTGQVLTNDSSGNLYWGNTATTTFTLPIPTCLATSTVNAINININTASYWGSYHIPQTITVSKISFNIFSVGTAARLKIGLYDASGNTQLFSTTTETITAAGVYTDKLTTPVTVKAGIYYLGVVGVEGSIGIQPSTWSCATPISNYFGNITGEPVLSGTRTEGAGTLPTSFDTTAITYTTTAPLLFRLDSN